MINAIDIAYAAGLFEGEGTLRIDRYFRTRKGEKRVRITPQLKLRVCMTDEAPVRRFAVIFNGRVHGPYQYSKGVKSKEHYKPYWLADVDSPPMVSLAIREMWSFLSPRRQEQLKVGYSL